jgi:hypothetical protein
MCGSFLTSRGESKNGSEDFSVIFLELCQFPDFGKMFERFKYLVFILQLSAYFICHITAHIECISDIFVLIQYLYHILATLHILSSLLVYFYFTRHSLRTT